jgi:hypothetical protein
VFLLRAFLVTISLIGDEYAISLIGGEYAIEDSLA